jgi:hypothetical protein
MGPATSDLYLLPFLEYVLFVDTLKKRVLYGSYLSIGCIQHKYV